MLSLTSSQIQSPGTCEVMMREMRIDIYKKDDCVKYYKRITPPLTLPPKKISYGGGKKTEHILIWEIKECL